MIDLRPLRQFVVLAEELHFGRAAARLHMTQPPLSMAMQALERTLGAPLFVRSQRAVALSPAGAALLGPVRRLLQQAEELPRLAQAAADGLSGRLRLAFVSNIAYGPLPEWLRGFRQAQPEVALDLHEATLPVLLDAFAADEIDAAFALHAPGAAPPGFAVWMALRETMAMAMPATHPLAADSALPPQAQFALLAAEPLVIFPRAVTPSLYDAVLAFYRARGATPRIAQEANQMQTIVNLVSAGIGVAWVPASVMQLRRPGVVYRQVAGDSLQCETSLLWREPVAPVLARFIAHVRAQAAETAQQGAVGTIAHP